MTSGASTGPDGSTSRLAILLRTWRERALLTQEQLASRAGLAVRTIRRLESDDARRPHGHSLRLIADALELSGAERRRLVEVGRGGPAGTLVPRQLPAAPAGFTGRVDVLRRLDGLLTGTSGPATVVISAIAGTAGIGKTALAVHWAHRVADRFPDGQLYVNLRGYDPAEIPVPAGMAVRGFLDALNVPPRRIPVDLDAQFALYRSVLADRRVLILLDNAVDAEQVRPLLPGSPGCLALVTSRSQLTGLVATESAEPLTLNLLSQSEAQALLERRLGPGRVATEPEAVEEIIASCAGLPLALAIVAARLASRPDRPLSAAAAELREPDGRLDALDAGEAATDLRQVFSWSYRRLSAGAATLFRLLGLHPGPDISVAASASLAGISPRAARRALGELARAHLVAEHAPGRYARHDLLHAFAIELVGTVDPERDRRAVLRRMLDHYLHTARSAADLIQPHRERSTAGAPAPGTTPEDFADHRQAAAWLAVEYPVLRGLLDQTIDRGGYDSHSQQLAWTLSTFLQRHGYWHDWLAIETAALGAAKRLADVAGQARANRGIGGALEVLGRHAEAKNHVQRALDQYARVGDKVGQAHAHSNLALLLGEQGDYRAAIRHAQDALGLYRATGNLAWSANMLSNIGWYMSQLGEHREALKLCEEAVATQERVGEGYGLAGGLDSLGYAHHHLDHYEQAAACYQRAIDLYRDFGDRYYEATTFVHLGDTHQAAGSLDAARDAWRQALDLLRALDHPEADPLARKLKRLSHAARQP
jgi:tetratricopeptide (TPR) repeat protein/transcriptional regulator with XRE-family HTH domain